MSIFQALDPAAAFGQGQPHRPLHSHVLQCSLRQVTASLSHVFPAFALFKLPEKSMVSNCVLSRYATRSLYGYCPQWALNWEYRFNQMKTWSGNSSFIPPLQEERHFG